jgi:hypothetical protein
MLDQVLAGQHVDLLTLVAEAVMNNDSFARFSSKLLVQVMAGQHVDLLKVVGEVLFDRLFEREVSYM